MATPKSPHQRYIRHAHVPGVLEPDDVGLDDPSAAPSCRTAAADATKIGAVADAVASAASVDGVGTIADVDAAEGVATSDAGGVAVRGETVLDDEADDRRALQEGRQPKALQ